jgi:transcriptional regulator with XRE-family HTH domain
LTPGGEAAGVLVRDARRRRDLSLRELAALAAVTVSWLHKLERGEIPEPSGRRLRLVAEALGVAPARLLRAAGYLP